MKFIEKLAEASRRNRSLLCVGLDPDPETMPPVSVLDFNRAIIEATADLVCAYKPNLAFYEALGIDGMNTLLKTVECIPAGIPIIADGKRGDIGNTGRMYARAIFSVLGFDAATVSPYMGHDSVQPFLEYEDRGVFILCRTSNPGSVDFQSLRCGSDDGELYLAVARKAKTWNTRDNVGLVVGATSPEELRRVRVLCPDMMLLIPGVGTQGGDLASSVRYGIDASGERAIIVSSRQILYASRNTDFASAARKVATELRDRINAVRRGEQPKA
ncbi:MAG: orotidine-5'-phosphate decarboxylase [Chloroflexi bacterium]|nr:orotidine-5'-phosphate decarboxylase [Chloroflexota bacterium]